MRAKVVTVDSFGAIVQFPGGIKALCPLSHMSELEIPKLGKKFQVGLLKFLIECFLLIFFFLVEDTIIVTEINMSL